MLLYVLNMTKNCWSEVAWGKKYFAYASPLTDAQKTRREGMRDWESRSEQEACLSIRAT